MAARHCSFSFTGLSAACLLVLLLCVSSTLALPSSSIVGRKPRVSFDANCNNPLPNGSNQYGRAIKTRKDLVLRAMQDVQTLVNNAVDPKLRMDTA